MFVVSMRLCLSVQCQQKVLHQLNLAVKNHVTPGGVVVFGDNDNSTIIPFGHLCYDSDSSLVDFDTLYDVASLTKPVVTMALVMQLIAQNKLNLNQSASCWIDAWRHTEYATITIADLAQHRSGLPAHYPFYHQVSSSFDPSYKQIIIDLATKIPLEFLPKTKTIYSDCGYIILGHILETIMDQPLDILAQKYVFEPLSMTSSYFFPRNNPIPTDLVIAPTEASQTISRQAGQVHDDNAFAGGGVFGHAGLFSTATDIDSFAYAMILGAQGQSIGDFDPEIVTQCFTAISKDTTWRTGWDTPSSVVGTSHAGDLWPRDGVGHLGFTGCSLWLDPTTARRVILLTNYIHPLGANSNAIKGLRRQIMDMIAREVYGSKQ